MQRLNKKPILKLYSPVFRLKITFFFSLLFSCLLSWNCTKIDNTNIGSDLLPVVDNVNTFDTLINVIANNFDSADCAEVYPNDDHVLGYISDDPYFGKTTAAIFTELKPAGFPYSFPATAANMTLDSVVLVLSYKRLYGDSLTPQKVNVYQVNTGFKFDSSTCSSQAYDPLVLGSKIYIPSRLSDSIFLPNDTSDNQLRITLNNSFGQDLLKQDTTGAFKSDSLFKEFFSGFAIIPDVGFGGNALTYFSLAADTNTKLSLYFKYNNGSIHDTVVNFRLTTTSATANNIVRDSTDAEILNHLGQPPLGNDFVYIQTTPGTYAEIKIPGLIDFPNKIVHRAELVMDQVFSTAPTDGYFTSPSLLHLEIKNSDTSFRPIPCDFNTLSGQPNFGTFGGFRTFAKDHSGNTISRYTFVITRYIQKIITNGTTNYTLKLSAPDYITNPKSFIDECGQGVSSFFGLFMNYLTVGRVKLGGNVPDYRMRLRIIYSNI